MVAIIKCVGVERSLLDSNEEFYTKLGEEWVWKPIRRRDDWERDKGSGLTLIVADNEVIKLGWTSRRGWDGARGQKLEVSRIEPVVPPVSYARLTGRLASRFAAHLVDEGRLSPGTGKALVRTLIEERPDLGDVIARIEGVADKYPINSPADRVMALQRDASIVAVRMAGSSGPAELPPNLCTSRSSRASTGTKLWYSQHCSVMICLSPNGTRKSGTSHGGVDPVRRPGPGAQQPSRCVRTPLRCARVRLQGLSSHDMLILCDMPVLGCLAHGRTRFSSSWHVFAKGVAVNAALTATGLVPGPGHGRGPPGPGRADCPRPR